MRQKLLMKGVIFLILAVFCSGISVYCTTVTNTTPISTDSKTPVQQPTVSAENFYCFLACVSYAHSALEGNYSDNLFKIMTDMCYASWCQRT